MVFGGVTYSRPRHLRARIATGADKLISNRMSAPPLRPDSQVTKRRPRESVGHATRGSFLGGHHEGPKNRPTNFSASESKRPMDGMDGRIERAK